MKTKPPEWITLKVRVEDRDELHKLRKEMILLGASRLPKVAQRRLGDGNIFSQGNVFGIAVAMARAEITSKRGTK